MPSSAGSARSSWRDSSGTTRSAGIADTNQSALTRRRRPRRSRTTAERTRPPLTSSATRAGPGGSAPPALEHLDPGLDPGLVGGRVQHPVQRAVVAALHDVHDERLGHVADRAGRGHGLLGRHQRAGQPARGDLLVLLGAAGGAHVVPPAPRAPTGRTGAPRSWSGTPPAVTPGSPPRAAGPSSSSRSPRSGAPGGPGASWPPPGPGSSRTAARPHGRWSARSGPRRCPRGCRRRRWRSCRRACAASSPGCGGRSPGRSGSRARRATGARPLPLPGTSIERALPPRATGS